MAEGITNGRWQGRVDEKLEQQATNIAEMNRNLRAIERELQAWRQEYLDQRLQDAAEKKADLRWRIGTTIAIIMAILAAAGIVVSAL